VLSTLEQALSLDPDSLAANAFTAIYWQRQGDLEQARRYLKRAARLESRNPAMQIYLGELWAQEGELDTARLYYQNAIDLARRDPAVWRAYADFCLRYSLDLHTQALPAARKAVLLAPDDPSSLDTLGLVLFRLGDRLNAARLWRRALAQDEDHAPTHLHLGVLYWYRGETVLARYHLSRANSLAPASPVGSQARRLLGELP
jgi:Flp pilus assembly protein TadD